MMSTTPRQTWWPRLTRGWSLIVLAVASVACSAARPTPSRSLDRQTTSPAPQQSEPESNDPIDADLLAAHNAERGRKRLLPLSLSPDLTRAAQVQAADMARRGKMAHRGGDGSSPFDRIRRAGYPFQAAGENVAYGFAGVDAVMAGWMRSPGHRRNILGQFTAMGAGRAIAPDGVSYWCVTFGTPISARFHQPGSVVR